MGVEKVRTAQLTAFLLSEEMGEVTYCGAIPKRRGRIMACKRSGRRRVMVQMRAWSGFWWFSRTTKAKKRGSLEGFLSLLDRLEGQ
jgi:hypothetical protein